MEINGAHFLLVCWGKMLREVVPMVLCSWAPDYLPLTLLGLVSEPVKWHVDDFGEALFAGVIEDSFSTFVVSSKHRGRLGVVQFDEGLSDGAAILGVHESSSHFGLGC
jgi:hypothetical protein